MTDSGDLEPRVRAVETELGELKGRVVRAEQDAAAARVLAGGADRDVAEIRSEIREFRAHTTALFNANRADLVDLRAEMRRGFAEVDRGFIEVRGRLDGVAAGQQRIVELLTDVIDRADEDG